LEWWVRWGVVRAVPGSTTVPPLVGASGDEQLLTALDRAGWSRQYPKGRDRSCI